MLFLINLDNVHIAGLRVSELLTENDTVALFYSDSNEKNEQGALNLIFSSGCNIVLRKVKTKGENTLDFFRGLCWRAIGQSVCGVCCHHKQ